MKALNVALETLKMDETRWSENSEITHPATQRHSPQDRNP